jgi:subtilisin family serine protease
MSRLSRRQGAGLCAFALAAALAVPVAMIDRTASAAPAPAARAGAAGLSWVTLLTGDRVGLRPGVRPHVAGSVRILPAAGREKVRFIRYLDHGDTYVLPADAAPLVNAGRLDRRLFDVTKLVAFGYGDRSRPDLPLIVTYSGGLAASGRARLAGAGARVGRDLPSIGGSAVRAAKAGAFWSTARADLASAGATPRAAGSTLARVWLDAPVRATLDHSVPQIGAPAAWQAGFTGAGSTVAVLDTGLDATHPDLADAVAGAQDFTDDDVAGTDDGFGHGTHVASIVTGNGAASNGKYAGVAPDAKLLVGKVLDDFGGGADSWIIAGMEWAAAQHAKVVNMSFGSPFPADGTDPVEQALTRLTAGGGPLFVVSAGNSGPDGETVGSPAEVPAALTVGAVDRQDGLAEFSSFGPVNLDGAIKPDLTAPGVDIVAAKAAHAQIGEPVGDAYLRLSGTSMAAPHVAGAAAILAGEHPDWTAGQLKAALVGSATPGSGISVDQQGAGRVDVARAVNQTAYATPANISLATARWPHADDPVINQTVTYHNAGTTPVTLNVAPAMTDQAGHPAAAGMFALSAPTVTVPAGGSASVRLSAVTTGAAPDGRYTGVLTATGGGTSIRTPVALTKEVESYDVPVKVLDRAGKPTPNYFFRFVDIDHPKAYFPYDPSGTVLARLPKGRFYFEGFVQTRIGSGEFDLDLTELFEPNLVISGPRTVPLDARRGKPLGFTLDRPAASSAAEFDSFLTTTWGETGSAVVGPTFDDVFVAPSVTVAPPGKYAFNVVEVAARPDGNGGFDRSPYLYQVGWTQPDRVPSLLIRHLGDGALAVRTHQLGGPVPGAIGLFGGAVTRPLPGTVTVLSTPGLAVVQDLAELTPTGDFGTDQLSSSGAASRPGPTGSEKWNRPVFGPGFPSGPVAGSFVARFGDEIGADIPLFSDQNATHFGFSRADGSTRLFKDGHLVGEEQFPGFIDVFVPAGDGVFRLETEATRTVSPLSTRVSGVWTFRSGSVPGEPVALPLAAVRFAPVVDDQGRPPAGRRLLPVPVLVQRQAGGGFGQLAGLTVQASFDDGATWQPVPLAGAGDRRTAMVRQPAGPRFVSLRATATDRSGNSVQQTIIRAYVLR